MADQNFDFLTLGQEWQEQRKHQQRKTSFDQDQAQPFMTTLGQEWQEQRKESDNDELGDGAIFTNVLLGRPPAPPEPISRFLNNKDMRTTLFLSQDQIQNLHQTPQQSPEQQWNYSRSPHAVTDIFPLNAAGMPPQFRDYRNPPALSERGTHTIDSGYGGDGSRRQPPSVGGFTAPGSDAFGISMSVIDNVNNFNMDDDKSVQDVSSTVKSKNGKSTVHCELCQKDLVMTKSEFRKHINRHEKPFKCPRCNKGFATNNDLVRHRGTAHSEHKLLESVLVCPDCVKHKNKIKVWARPDNFRTHLFKVHNIPKTTNLNKYKCPPDKLPGDPVFSVVDSVIGGSDGPYDGTIYEEQEEDDLLLEDNSFIAQPNFVVSALGGLTEPENPFPEHLIANDFAQDADRTIDVPKADEDIVSPVKSPKSKAPAANNGGSWSQSRRMTTGHVETSRPEVIEFLRSFPRQDLKTAIGYDESDAASEEPATASQVGTNGAHVCEKCQKVFKRRCQLNKHRLRHDQLWRCTNYKCPKTFGSKNDWKRHEWGMHYSHQEWKCNDQGCNEIYQRRQHFEAHIIRCHNVIKESDQFTNKVTECRRDRQGPENFWCGFCNDHITPNQGVKAWDYKFDHIDNHLFGRQGLEKKRMSDWAYLEDRPSRKAQQAKALADRNGGITRQESMTSGKTDQESSSLKKRKNDDGASSPRKRNSDSSNYVWNCCQCSSVGMSINICSMCFDCNHRVCQQCTSELYTVEEPEAGPSSLL